MILINEICELRKYRWLISRLYSGYGQTHFHHYFGMESGLVQNKDKDFYIIIDSKNSIVSAFERKDLNTWECFFKGFPILASAKMDRAKIKEFIKGVKSVLNASTLYFPLVYWTDSARAIFGSDDIFFTIKRLPNKIINPPLDQAKIWARVRKRYGSRADRQKVRFEKNFTTQTFTKIDVREQISKVEQSSWKSIFKQDMLSRENQIDFYSSLIKLGLAEIIFAYDSNGSPIAFIISASINDVLFVLKWSYNDDFKKYSPGFYLLTVKLFKQNKIDQYKYVDLYGSEDSLKALIATGEFERMDIVVSDDVKEKKMLSARKTSYDDKVRKNFLKHQGIRYLFKSN
jgi:hypothetical protein